MADEISALEKHACPACGAQAEWNPTKQKLVCPFCGTESPYADRSRDRQGRRGRSRRGAARPARRRARLADRTPQRPVPELQGGDGLRGRSRRPELRVLRLAGARQLRRDQGADPSAGRPPVPRRHRAASATTSAAGGAASGWRPTSCRRPSLVDTVHGLYIPYWTFDAQVHCPWDAEAGHYYYVTVEGRDSKGRSVTRQERRVRWEAASGVVDHFFDDEPVPGDAGAAARPAAPGRAVPDAGSRLLRHRVSLPDTSSSTTRSCCSTPPTSRRSRCSAR